MSSSLPWDAVVLLTLIFVTPLVALLVVLSFAWSKVGKRWRLLPPDSSSWVERPWVYWPAAGVLILYILCFGYGMTIEARWVELTRTEIPVSRPVLGYEKFRIVHLSDLHLESIGSREHRVVELVREARPHLILLTGDYMNVREGGAALRELLGALQAPHGVFGVEGNWDPKFLTSDYFAKAGATLLVDDTQVLERDGHKLRLAGSGIVPQRTLRDLLPAADDGVFTIFLAHKPDEADALGTRAPGQRVDLFLCGHTHGGQVCLPFWGAVITLSKHHKKYERGLYDVGGVPMYVNRGVGLEGGAAPRVRFLSRPEVAVIDLVRK